MYAPCAAPNNFSLFFRLVLNPFFLLAANFTCWVLNSDVLAFTFTLVEFWKILYVTLHWHLWKSIGAPVRLHLTLNAPYNSSNEVFQFPFGLFLNHFLVGGQFHFLILNNFICLFSWYEIFDISVVTPIVPLMLKILLSNQIDITIDHSTCQ